MTAPHWTRPGRAVLALRRLSGSLLPLPIAAARAVPEPVTDAERSLNDIN